MKPVCTICRGEGDFLLKKDGYDLYQCATCSLVFVSLLPTEDFLSTQVYSTESGYQAHKKSDFSKLVQDIKTKKIFKALGGGHGKTLLDVGCSSGEFLYWAQCAGFKAFGVELNPRTAGIAQKNGFDVLIGTIDAVVYPPESFDVIFLGDVIEHVRDPRALVLSCKKLLKNGGMLVISTPNLDCLWARITLVLYRAFAIPPSTLTPPYHLFQFSKGNLDRLLAECSFKNTTEFFLKPPRLVYELGMLHLRTRYKQERSTASLLYMFSAYGLYTVAYGMVRLLSPFLSTDFSMVILYQKDNA